MKNNESIEGVILAILSIIFIRESLKLHNNQSWSLSPALFPLIITSMVLLFSLILVFNNLKKATNYRNKGNRKIMLLILALSFLYFLSLGRFNFLLSTGLYLFGFMYILGENRWWIISAFIIIIPLGIQYVFGNLLGVLLP